MGAKPLSRGPGRARTVAILAGGAGRRMGGDKAGARLGDRSLAGHAVAIARAAGLRPLIVARADTELPADHGAGVLVEPAGPRHPLAGVAAALDAVRAPIVVLACDMPLVPPPFVARLAALAGAPALVPLHGSRLEPLCARYEPAAAAPLRHAAERGEPARAAVAALAPRVIGPAQLAAHGDPAIWLASVNTPAELAAAERVLGERARR